MCAGLCSIIIEWLFLVFGVLAFLTAVVILGAFIALLMGDQP